MLTITSLPREILQYIFAFIPARDLTINASLVSKLFNELGDDMVFWRLKCTNEFAVGITGNSMFYVIALILYHYSFRLDMCFTLHTCSILIYFKAYPQIDWRREYVLMKNYWETIACNLLRFDSIYDGMIHLQIDSDQHVVFTNIRVRREGVTNATPVVSYIIFMHHFQSLNSIKLT